MCAPKFRVVRSKSSSESEHCSDDGNGALEFEFKTVTVALIAFVAAGILTVTVAPAVVVVVVVFDLECSFNSRFSQIFVVSFKFFSLARLLLTSIAFTEFVFRTDIFYCHFPKLNALSLSLPLYQTDFINSFILSNLTFLQANNVILNRMLNDKCERKCGAFQFLFLFLQTFLFLFLQCKARPFLTKTIKTQLLMSMKEIDLIKKPDSLKTTRKSRFMAKQCKFSHQLLVNDFDYRSSHSHIE